MSTESEPFSLVLICLGTTKFVLLSVFTLKETICPQICSKSRLKSAKSLLPVDVGSPENGDGKWNSFTSHEGNFQHHFVPLFFARRPHQNCAHVSHAMAQSFRWNQPHFLPPKQTFLGVRHAFLPYSCRAGTRDANVCVERLSHFLKRSEGIQLRSPSPNIANISHLRSCFDSWACPNHILRHISSYGFQHSHSSCAGFITQLKYSSL